MHTEEYEITYTTQNTYEHWVNNAYWQFLITPMQNNTQRNITVEFSNSLFAVNEYSINGYGFNTIRIHPKDRFKEISFLAKIKLLKEYEDPFNFPLNTDNTLAYKQLEQLLFKIDFEAFLKSTVLTYVPKGKVNYLFNPKHSIFKNLQELNSWVSNYLTFKTGVTKVDSTLKEVLNSKQGVCQDYTHLFCSIARKNGIPARYVSGYLNQSKGFTGDSQMHAWAEVYIPQIGWKGFDPTNNILANTNHIKVCHGKDYNDCAPLKGIIYALGTNKTKYQVKVQSEQQ